MTVAANASAVLQTASRACILQQIGYVDSTSGKFASGRARTRLTDSFPELL
jgi:hypothetical protein